MSWTLNAFIQVSFILLALYIGSTSPLASPHQNEADTVAQQLRDLPTPLPSSPRSDGSIAPEEERRRQLYERLLLLGSNGVLALGRALTADDPRLRKNAALALTMLAGGWYDLSWPKLNIKSVLPTLITALQDSDADVRAWSAQAIGQIGPDAAKAVPDLITLLSNPDEGSRNSACIALRFIGPAAKKALPELNRALSSPSKDVRRFAALAIDSIER
jgi:HEAT repeat protein